MAVQEMLRPRMRGVLRCSDCCSRSWPDSSPPLGEGLLSRGYATFTAPEAKRTNPSRARARGWAAGSPDLSKVPACSARPGLAQGRVTNVEVRLDLIAAPLVDDLPAHDAPGVC